jgi:hypothetical protein
MAEPTEKYSLISKSTHKLVASVETAECLNCHGVCITGNVINTPCDE